VEKIAWGIVEKVDGGGFAPATHCSRELPQGSGRDEFNRGAVPQNPDSAAGFPKSRNWKDMKNMKGMKVSDCIDAATRWTWRATAND
jgi:hypothetical protein